MLREPGSRHSPVTHSQGSHFEVFQKLQAIATSLKETIIKKSLLAYINSQLETEE